MGRCRRSPRARRCRSLCDRVAGMPGDQLGAAPVDRLRVVENLELMDAHYSFFSRWPPNW